MICDYCNPNVVDYGFEMNDTRAEYWVTPKHKMCGCGVDEDCEDCEARVARITIVRNWQTCRDCGIGSTYTCQWNVSTPKGNATCNSSDAAYSVLHALCEGYHMEDAREDYRAERYAHPYGMY